MIIGTITPKFQLHIPLKIRRQLGITKPQKVRISIAGEAIVIKPLKSSFLSMGGKFQVKKPYPADKIRDIIDYS